jgi:arginine:ornithine antiporter / lysine permease
VASESTQRLSRFALTRAVVGSMIGAGIFSLPRTFGNATGPFGANFARTIAVHVGAVRPQNLHKGGVPL